LPVDAQVFAFVRSHGGERVFCLFNFSATPANYPLPPECKVARVLGDSGLAGASVRSNTVEMAPWGGMFALLA
jgi:alpha-glucosidase